jgi:hypothetical protein
MANKADLPVVFAQLKALLAPYAPRLKVTADTAESFSLDAGYAEVYKREMFFGAAQVKKNYVSFYLMPVYVHPELLDGISEKLRRRMQGKSCFNFTAVDEETFAELASLTARGLAAYEQDGYIPSQGERA